MKIIDLSLPIQKGMFVYPGDPEVEIEQIQTLDKNGWNMKRIHMNCHDGTHINVPIHCIKNGKCLDDFEIADFSGECVVYEKEADIQKGMGIIFKEKINMKIAKEIVRVKPKFVGFAIEINEKIERYLLNNEIILFERLTNISSLPKKFYFYGVPLSIKEGDGSPVRAFAIVS